MQARAFWKAVTVDRSNLLDRVLELLRAHQVEFCLIGGQALNAYVEPVVSLDLDIVVATSQLQEVESLVKARFEVERLAHSLNISQPGSDLRIQIQLDPRYAPFLARAEDKDVLGYRLPVARIEDVLSGKVWAVQDATRRGSKQKDLADIARVLEARADLRSEVPPDIPAKLV